MSLFTAEPRPRMPLPLPLTRHLEEALPRTDSRGRFTETDARKLRALVSEVRSEGASFSLSPEGLFGPWAALPEHVRGYLRALAEDEIGGTMAFHPRGRIWPGLVRGMYTLSRSFSKKRGLSWLARKSLLWAPRVWFRPRMTRSAVVWLVRTSLWRWSPRPRISHLISALGKTPQWLMGVFAEGVGVDHRCRGFFHDPGKRVVYGFLLGVDLVPTPAGVVCYEANLNAGISERMRRDLWDTDPIPEGLAGFAEERGLRRVIWVGADLTPLDPWFYGQLREGLERRGVGLEVLEDVRLPTRRDVPEGLPMPSRSLFPPSDPAEGSLVVRVRSYRVGPDLVVSDKEAFSGALGLELARTHDRRVRVLPFSREPGEVALPDDPGLPNLVYKYPRENQGKGVYFLRARDADHARGLSMKLDGITGEKGGRFQPWVSSSLLPGRRIYEYRAIILVTPAGVCFLGARRRETVTPLPQTLEDGIVQDRRPFIITGYFGNVSVRADPAEEPLIRGASLGVAEGLSGLLTRGFVTAL